jgi:hypothetical protein
MGYVYFYIYTCIYKWIYIYTIDMYVSWKKLILEEYLTLQSKLMGYVHMYICIYYLFVCIYMNLYIIFKDVFVYDVNLYECMEKNLLILEDYLIL